MADKKISELTNASGLNLTDLFVISQIFGNDWVSKNATLIQLANAINNGIDYTSDLQTTSKKPIGAINENKSSIDTLIDFVYGQLPVNSASGSIANFNTSLALPLVSCKAQIVASQSGSGTPSPSNPRAISGYDSIMIVHTGKNLFDKTNSSTILQGYLAKSDDTYYISTGSNVYIAFVKCKPNTTYTVSKLAGSRFIIGYTTELPEVGVTYYGYIAGSSSSSLTITTGNDAKYIVAYFYNGSYPDAHTYDDYLNSLQIETGSTATTYEAYNGETKTIALGQTVYGGSVDAVWGGGKKTKGFIVFDGSENWNVTSDGTVNRRFVLYTNTIDSSSPSTMKTNYLSFFNGTSSSWGTFSAGVSATYGNYFIIHDKDSNFADNTALKSYLNEHNLQVCFDISTPTTFSVTPQTIVANNGTNNIFADSGDVEVQFKQGVQEYIDAKIAETQALIL